MRDFDHNQMAELAALKRYRYERDGGGGAHTVHATAKAFYDSRGYSDWSELEQRWHEARVDFKERMALIFEHYRLDRLTSKGGFYHGDSIPF